MRLELKQQVEQRLAILFGKRCRRLVEDQQLDVLGKRLGDFDQLLLAGADIADQRVGIFAQAHLAQQFARTPANPIPIDDAALGLLIAEEHVLGDREHRHQRQFLMNDDDAELFRIVDAGEPALLALVLDLALVAAERINPGKNLHQG